MRFLLISMFLLGACEILPSQEKESILIGSEIVTFSNMVSEYVRTHDGEIPSNWSAIWDPSILANLQAGTGNRPMLFLRIAFVDDSAAGGDPSRPRIIAAIRNPIERSWKSYSGGPVLQRAMFILGADKVVRITFVDEGGAFWGSDISRLVFKEPDPSPEQLASVAKAMYNLGFKAEEIRGKFRKLDIDAMGDSKELSPAFWRMLSGEKAASSESIKREVSGHSSPVQANEMVVGRSEGSFEMKQWLLLLVVGGAIGCWLAYRRWRKH